MTRTILAAALAALLALPAAALEPGDKAIWYGSVRAKQWADGNRVFAPAEVTILPATSSTGQWVRFHANGRSSTVRPGDLRDPEVFRAADCPFVLRRWPGHPLCAR